MCKKMGIHNKITAERYATIKKELKSPSDDRSVMKKYGIGQTTARGIRRTRDYKQYRAKSSTARGINRRRLEQIMVENPIPEERSWQKPLVDRKVSPLVALTVAIGFMLYIFAIILIIWSKWG